MENFLKLIFMSIILFAVNVNAQTSDKTTDEIKTDHDKTDDQESHQENNDAISIAVLPKAYQEKIQKLEEYYLNQKSILLLNAHGFILRLNVIGLFLKLRNNKIEQVFRLKKISVAI